MLLCDCGAFALHLEIALKTTGWDLDDKGTT